MPLDGEHTCRGSLHARLPHHERQLSHGCRRAAQLLARRWQGRGPARRRASIICRRAISRSRSALRALSMLARRAGTERCRPWPRQR
ncbi:DUF982 domain-containing protein [Mesorhizobium sp. ORM16]|uniref:DUF982 domain-containing protein n=1 Tax=Mesorhizobium sp. ORM16 TaxID=3376989 RepID=UPI003857A985